LDENGESMTEALTVLDRYFKALSESLEPDILSAKIVAYLAKKGFSDVKRDAITETLIRFWKKPEWRDFVWLLHMKLPLSWIIRVVDRIDRTNSSLRSAVIVKLLITPEEEILKEFVRHPAAFRKMFRRLALPKDKFKGKPVKNRKWLFIASLISGENEILKKIRSGDVETLLKYRVPAYIALQYVIKSNKVKEYFEALARRWPDEFIRHYDACVRYLGSDVAEELKKVALRKTKPEVVVTKKALEEHLMEKKILSKEEVEAMRRRLIKRIEDILSSYDVQPVVVVDLSGSMTVVAGLVNMLKDTIFRNIPARYVAFSDYAFDITEEVKSGAPLSTGGSTSITAGLWFAKSIIEESGKKGLIILVSDLGHNTPCDEIPEDELKDDPVELLWWMIRKGIIVSALVVVCGGVNRRMLDRLRRVPKTKVVYIQDLDRADVMFKGFLELLEMTLDVKKAREILSEKILRRPKETKTKGFIESLLMNEKVPQELFSLAKL